MIPLLDQLVRLEENAAPVVGKRTSALLEWDAVTAQVAAFCRNDRAAERIANRVPKSSPPLRSLRNELADQMRVLDDRDAADLPLCLVGSVAELLERPGPMRLDGPDLICVAAAAEDLDVLRDFLTAHRSEAPVWGDAAVAMTSLGQVAGALRRALDPDGRIADSASSRLAALRRQVDSREREVRREVGAAMEKARRAGWTTAEEVTLRGDRFCIPLRSGDSRRLPGIVHDRSTTGATLFVEPAGVVSRANALVETRLEISAEEARILLELNRAVETAAPALRCGLQLVLLADEVRAGLRWSRAVGGRRARLDAAGRLRISGGRHPLLMEALGEGQGDAAATLRAGRKRVVPLDLELDPRQRALVISGPNAGGKSVALKTVGVFCLLTWSGWDVPARDDTILPEMDRVLADLGDEQSIRQGLSSFSSHLKHLARFLEDAGDHTLVLCDEIGSGTDPQEGTALAMGVLEKLVDRGARVLASTHFGLLKAAVHDHPQMVNAAMDYDEQDLQPLFSLRVGDPGTSHAFDIAARMGLPADLLVQARARAGTERVQVEKLLADLDRRARDLIRTQHDLEQERAVHASRNRELEKRLADIEKERREILKATRKDAEELARQGRRAIEQAVRDIRSSGADKSVVRTARDRIAGLGPEAADPEGAGARPPRLVVGQRVRIPHLNLIGTVMEVRSGKVVALAENLRLNLDVASVMPLEGEQDTGATRDPGAAGGWAWHDESPAVAPEIDLRGQRGEEAWELLDRLIDRAIPTGMEIVNVIHGFGTGRLRDFIYERLQRDARVASVSEAGPGQGGGGVAVVRLKIR